MCIRSENLRTRFLMPSSAALSFLFMMNVALTSSIQKFVETFSVSTIYEYKFEMKTLFISVKSTFHFRFIYFSILFFVLSNFLIEDKVLGKK